jgi:precorrin-2 dehydrogenase/sirohydrochlorin ferrochelatase
LSYFPIFLELEGKKALVVGGGKVAQRKIESLLEHGASIGIIAKQLTTKLNKLVESGKIEHVGKEFKDKHLDDAFLVIAATDEKQLNHRISERARKRGLLINAVDQPSDCDFIFPSIVKRGDLLIAISTSGKSPALAKKLKKELESRFGREYETLLVLMGRLRREILSKGLSQDENNRIFHEIVDSDILEALAQDDWERVKSTLGRILPGDLAMHISTRLMAHSKVEKA